MWSGTRGDANCRRANCSGACRRRTDPVILASSLDQCQMAQGRFQEVANDASRFLFYVVGTFSRLALS
jgi:hypothetical protein